MKLLYSILFIFITSSSLFSVCNPPDGSYWKMKDYYPQTFYSGCSYFPYLPSLTESCTSTEYRKDERFNFVNGGCYKDYSFSTKVSIYTSIIKPTCSLGNYFNTSSESCEPIPTCSLGNYFNTSSESCEPIPENPDEDIDGDGISDKCDFDFIDYASSDCDGDGLENAMDDDIDGDGVLNVQDLDDNGDDIRDYKQEGSEDFNIDCLGADISMAGTLPFSFTNYSFYANFDNLRCTDLLFTNTTIDSVFSVPDKNDGCGKSYCYVHYKKGNCDFDVSFYLPGNDWDYIINKTESECDLIVDNIRYSSSSYSQPNTLNCPDVGYCFLKRIDNDPAPENSNSEDSDSTMEAPDLNSTTLDNQPLLQAQNTTNKHLDDLKIKTDITNKNLDDLKKTANDTLNNNKDMKSILSILKSNSDNSLINQSQSLLSLNSLSSIFKNFSDTSTSNQGVIDGTLSSIDDKMTINNDLLSGINDFLNDDTAVDTTSLDGFDSDLSTFETFISDIGGQYSIFKTNIESNLASIETQYMDTKSFLENPFTPVSIAGASTDCVSFNFHGTNISIDYGILSVFYPFVNFITTVFFMFFILKFSINHILKGLE